MDHETSNKRTHNLETSSECPASKRSKIDVNITTTSVVNLLDLSDCVLTLILEYVTSYDLYALSETCTRLNNLITAKKLWSSVDVRSHRMCGRKFKFFYGNLNDSTERLMVSGINPTEKCITNHQFHRLSRITSTLSVLAMEYQLINSNEIQLRYFPGGLKELSLRGTHVEGSISIVFQEASSRLKHLHTLILDECYWIREHSLMALSKFPNLENLSVYKCKNLRDSMAYMSLTTRFGFKRILRIDARLTKIGDEFLKCLNNLRTIRELYLEAPVKHQRNTNVNFGFVPKKSRPPQPQPPPPRSIPPKTNRISTYCLDEFRQCDKAKCSFKPEHLNNETDDDNTCDFLLDEQQPAANVIVVSPFDHNNDVRVHVLYDAPFAFERLQASTQDQQHQHHVEQREQNDNDSNVTDDDEDPNEILYNVCNYATTPQSSPILYESTVTDDGIRWFTGSDTNADDHLGEESVLFQRPFNATCTCTRNACSTWDEQTAGPSGVNQPEQPPSENNANVDADADANADADADAGGAYVSIRYMDRRDLRVVIERVEPGIQIIVNNHNNINNNNNNNINALNCLTRLKVFVARNFNRITDRAMLHLSGVRLELLDVTRTSVSADAVRRFLLLNPDCRVIHESTCRCMPDTNTIH